MNKPIAWYEPPKANDVLVQKPFGLRQPEAGLPAQPVVRPDSGNAPMVRTESSPEHTPLTTRRGTDGEPNGPAGRTSRGRRRRLIVVEP
ncbi:hypothetical protein J31TS4_26680 [Paenibacillus sp. J31TS4]|uniref:hypothetical protein n=1 Tax=Paenibacillus sp. J31TS4 TaxID=2807195 RepID=UPI001B2AB84F|nr:hypothetical protein [Paenibacillus sp. J31TS4]GIP39388.1 hypothetical protein J31TS4_26680 [Paenibacillus sp. J31TS4]